VATASQYIATRPALRQPEELIPPQQAGYYQDEPAAAPMAPERAGAPPAEGHVVAGDVVGDPADCPGCQNNHGDCCCNNQCCNSGYGGWGWGNCLGDCCLGDAWTLKSCLTPCCDTNYGGWFSFGYYNHNERLSFDRGDERSFNDLPNNLNLDQAWFYVENPAEADGCCADYGYRVDMMYGAQGHAAQSFGNDGGTWDVAWDHGPYEWAIPQLYAEVAWGDWNVKVGHFFTPAGYEVVAATGNFFYSHTLTHYNSEPFTHTGILGTYSANDCLTWYAGWTLGWDTGFDRFGDGSNFLGGVGYEASDDVTLTYIVTAGNLGWRSGDQDGWSHHFVGLFDLSECWQYVLQHDYVNTDGTIVDNTFDNEDYGVSNYLFYTINDCWKLGARAEWWKSNNVVVGDAISFYDVAFGVNYRPDANLVIRPEVRYDWVPAEDVVNASEGEDYNQTWLGVDAILTY
jgi:hypothetical protein